MSAREACSKRRFPEGSLVSIVERKQGHQVESHRPKQTWRDDDDGKANSVHLERGISKGGRECQRALGGSRSCPPRLKLDLCLTN